MSCAFPLATHAHVAFLAPRLRDADLRELAAVRGRPDARAALLDGLNSPDPTYTALVDGEPVCMFGTAPSAFPEAGQVWLLGTDRLRQLSSIFLRQSRPWVSRLHARYPVLANCCDKRNDVHIRWLRWCGFTFIREHATFGVARVPFLEFVRISHV